MIKSCLTCPSYIPAEDQDDAAKAFGRVPGVGMCGRFGHVISRAGQKPKAQEAAAQTLASACDSYGMERPPVPETMVALMLNPDNDSLTKASSPGACGSCMNCANLLKSDVAFNAFNVGVPICKAKGKLVFKPNVEAKACPWARPGVPSGDASGLDFIEHLGNHFRISEKSVIDSMHARQNTAIEPLSYETDKPLTEEDVENGYRAWRKVVNPDNPSQFGYLPIFDPDYLTEEERKLVPVSGSEEHPELYIDYFGGLYDFTVEAHELDETPLLIGQPGVGKTEFLRWIAWLMQIPFRRYQMGKFTEVDDLIGSPQYDPALGTYFKEGRLPQAYRRPGLNDIDEINLARGEIREYLRPLTDNSKQFVLDSAHGVVVERHHGSYLAFTMNPAWDMRNSGTEDFAAADSNRLSPIWIDTPPEAVERHIIRQRCEIDGYKIPDATLDKIMAISVDIRELCKQDVFPDWWGTRQTIKVARKTRWYGLAKAFKRASLDFYDPEMVSMVLEIVQSHIE